MQTTLSVILEEYNVAIRSTARTYSNIGAALLCYVAYSVLLKIYPKERHNRTWHVAMTFMSLHIPFGAIWPILCLCIVRTTKIVCFARKVMFYMPTCIVSICRKCLPWKSCYILVSHSTLYKLRVCVGALSARWHVLCRCTIKTKPLPWRLCYTCHSVLYDLYCDDVP